MVGTGRTSKYERRVQLALKWYHLDHLTIPEIQERFEQQGMGSYTTRTIKSYINTQASEEVLEQIRKKQAHTREQVADRQERLYQRAREAETESTKDEPIVGMVPETRSVDGRLSDPKRIPYSWEQISPEDDDWPEWGDPDLDTIIRITDGEEYVQPGHEYPARDYLGRPKYTKQLVGLEREVPDRTSRSFLRQEQQSHLEAKGKALGIYEESIQISGSLDVDTSVEVPDHLVEAVVSASKHNLTDTDDGEQEDES